MPELPEVETIVRDIRPRLLGRTVERNLRGAEPGGNDRRAGLLARLEPPEPPADHEHQERAVNRGAAWGEHNRPGWGRCKIRGCYETAVRRRWCAGHYARWRITGDPLGSPPPEQHSRSER